MTGKRFRIPVTLLSPLQGQLDQHPFIPGRTPLFRSSSSRAASHHSWLSPGKLICDSLFDFEREAQTATATTKRVLSVITGSSGALLFLKLRAGYFHSFQVCKREAIAAAYIAEDMEQSSERRCLGDCAIVR